MDGDATDYTGGCRVRTFTCLGNAAKIQVQYFIIHTFSEIFLLTEQQRRDH